MSYKPRNRNRRANEDTAPIAWSQQFYDSRPPREQPRPCGFHVPETER